MKNTEEKTNSCFYDVESVQRELRQNQVELRFHQNLLGPMKTLLDKKEEHLMKLRVRLVTELGFIMPTVRVRDDVSLDANCFAVLLNGVISVRGTAYPDRLLGLVTTKTKKLDEPHYDEPVLRAQCCWLSKKRHDELLQNEYAIMDATSFIWSYLYEQVKLKAWLLLRREDVYELLKLHRKQAQHLVDFTLSDHARVRCVHHVLRDLLRFSRSVHRLDLLLETLDEHDFVYDDEVKRRLSLNVKKAD